MNNYWIILSFSEQISNAKFLFGNYVKLYVGHYPPSKGFRDSFLESYPEHTCLIGKYSFAVIYNCDAYGRIEEAYSANEYWGKS